MFKDSSHRAKIGGVATGGLAFALAGAVAAYCLALRRYGLELADEGALLAHMDRVMHGQVPYRDFHVGYGPALYWLHAATFAVWGVSLTTVRVGLALVHAGRAGLLATLVAPLAGCRWAGALVLLLVGVFLPVAPGLCVPGNIPYPAWFADAIGLVALLVIARPSAPTLLVGGMWGLVFAFKQNNGVLGLGAAAATVVLGAAAPDGDRSGVPRLLALAMLAGALLLLRDFLDTTLATVFVVPLVPLAVAIGRAHVSRAVTGELARLAAGFVVVAGGVVLVMVARAGSAAVGRDFLQIGTDTLATYYVPHPSLAQVRDQLRGVAPDRAIRLLSEAAWFALLPALHLVATSLVAGGAIRSRQGVAIVAAAALGYLQLYPRMDFWHVLPLVPASLATLALLATRLGPRTRNIALAGIVVLALGRFAPTAPVLVAALSAPRQDPRVPRLDVDWSLVTDERVARVPDIVEAVRTRRRVAGFPAVGVVNFALGEPSPWRHDYFFPGRPTREEEAVLVADVARDPPDAVVMMDSPSGPFAAAFAAHVLLVDALEQRMVAEEHIGPYRILVPRRAP